MALASEEETMDAVAAKLIASYHAIYDVKDEQDVGSEGYYKAYLALQALADLMVAAGIEVPRRFDKERA